MAKLERGFKDWKASVQNIAKIYWLKQVVLQGWSIFWGMGGEHKNMRYKQQCILSPGKGPGLHTTSDSKISQQGWDIFRKKVGAYLGYAQTTSLPPPCQQYSQAWGCDGWRSGLRYGHNSFFCLFWQRWLFTMRILLPVNIPGKKSQRNTEKAPGFPFAAREIISKMENSAMNSQQKSTLTCIMVIRGVLGAGVYLLLPDMSLMSISETEMGPKVWKARGTSSVHSLPGITTGNSLFDYFFEHKP